MSSFRLQFVGVNDMIDWPHSVVRHLVHDQLEVAILEDGTTSGRPSCMLRVPLEDGTVAIVETTARIWVAIGRAIMGKYPRLLDDDGAKEGGTVQ